MTVKVTPESDREALENMLEAQRIGLIRKVEGVSDELARQAPTASSLSLLGLVGDIPAMAVVALNAPHHRSPGRANALTCRCQRGHADVSAQQLKQRTRRKNR